VEAGDERPQQSTVETLPFPLQLATLNSPKPSQFLFYLGDENSAPLDGRPKQPDEGYSGNHGKRRLRGRKVYLTHRDVLSGAAGAEEYWTLPQDPTVARQRLTGEGPQYREYVAPEGSKEKVTTTVTQWVKPGTEFTVLLRVDNLSKIELAALLWLLDLPDGAALQLGLGKPLGFGAVRVAADWDDVRLFTGDRVLERYRSLSSVPESEPLQTLRELIGEYDDLLTEHLAQVRAEFLAAATGFPGSPVHYPRTNPVPETESYLWWVANDVSGKQPGKRLALPRLPTRSRGCLTRLHLQGRVGSSSLLRLGCGHGLDGGGAEQVDEVGLGALGGGLGAGQPRQLGVLGLANVGAQLVEQSGQAGCAGAGEHVIESWS
jgi:hypothetical protein